MSHCDYYYVQVGDMKFGVLKGTDAMGNKYYEVCVCVYVILLGCAEHVERQMRDRYAGRQASAGKVLALFLSHPRCLSPCRLLCGLLGPMCSLLHTWGGRVLSCAVVCCDRGVMVRCTGCGVQDLDLPYGQHRWIEYKDCHNFDATMIQPE